MSWWDKPALIGHPYYSRKGEAQILGLMAVLAIFVMVMVGPLWGLALCLGAGGVGVKHAAWGRRRLATKLAGVGGGERRPVVLDRCSKRCRTSTEPAPGPDGQCGCTCGGVLHGQEVR